MITASREISMWMGTYSCWIIWEAVQYRDCELFFLHDDTRNVPHCHYLELVFSFLFLHFQHHLSRLSPLNLFDPYVNTIFAKFHLPHHLFIIFVQLPVVSQQFICAIFISIPPFPIQHYWN